MKKVKSILKILLITVVVLLVAAIFLKKVYVVERDIIINKPKTTVFNYLKYLKNQNDFSKWALMDTNAHREYIGLDGTEGFLYTWESNNSKVGKGEQRIKKIIAGKVIQTALHFIKPIEGFADAYLTTETISDNETRVRWGFYSKMNYPFNLSLLVLNMDKIIGDDLSEGLINLKKQLESKP